MNEGWVNPKLEIGVSRIDGRGLFAWLDVAEGERLTQTSDDYVVMTDEELDAYVETVESWDSVSLGGGRNKVWLGRREDNPAQFANHSCEPNAVMADDGLVAARAIAQGEEVTVDYGLSSRATWSMACTCGSPVCRSVINGVG